jgi:hypothetical protein
MRKMARSFFWIDQHIIRSGIWQKLSMEAKLSYVVISASADRDGLCQWGHQKLIEQIGEVAPESFTKSLEELETLNLIARGGPEKPGIELLNLSVEDERERQPSSPANNIRAKAPIIVHTTTTVTVGE